MTFKLFFFLLLRQPLIVGAAFRVLVLLKGPTVNQRLFQKVLDLLPGSDGACVNAASTHDAFLSFPPPPSHFATPVIFLRGCSSSFQPSPALLSRGLIRTSTCSVSVFAPSRWHHYAVTFCASCRRARTRPPCSPVALTRSAIKSRSS